MSPETIIKRHCIAYLSWRGIFNFPILQGIGAQKGIPDRIAIYKGRFIGIEIKTPKGRVSPYQESFKTECEAAGGVYLVIRDVDELKAWFEAEERKT